MVKEIVLAIVVSGFAVNAALALSCTAPNPVATFNWATERDAPYYVLTGKLDKFSSIKREIRHTFLFVGKQLTSAGFVQDLRVHITAERACVQSFPCDRVTLESGHYLLFVRQDTSGLILDVGPCKGSYFENPSPDMIKQLEDCIKGGPCRPASQ